MLTDPRTHYHDTELLVVHELHQPRDDTSFHHHINTVIVTVWQVGDCPACVRQDVLVAVMEQLDQRGKHLKEWQLQHITLMAPSPNWEWIFCGTVCQTGITVRLFITELWFHLPAGLQTRVETGSYCDTSWTMSMSGCAGSQPGVIKHFDQQVRTFRYPSHC